MKEYSDSKKDEIQNLVRVWAEEFKGDKRYQALTDSQKQESGFIIDVFADLIYGYFLQEPSEWTAAALEECCLDLLPRKVSAGPEFYKSLEPVLTGFFGFLEDKGYITGAQRLISCLKKVSGAMIELADNPDNWGPAKQLLMGATKAGVNLEDPNAFDRYVQMYNMMQSDRNMAPAAKVKVGRNDPCPCGSGKKYKKCCLSKHEEQKRLRQRLETVETLSDEYFSVNEYILESGYPVTMFDYFLMELLNISGGILYKYRKIDDSQVKGILVELLRAAKDFYSMCKECKYGCLEEPMKKISFKSLIDKGLRIEEFPNVLQRPVSINFFYFEFINVIIGSLAKELQNVLPESEVDDITFTVHCSIFDFIADNCWQGCNNRCMKKHDTNAYCNFCSFGENRLPCPKKGEVSYNAIKASEQDMIH